MSVPSVTSLFTSLALLVGLPATGAPPAAPQDAAATKSDDPTGQLAEFAEEIERVVAEGDPEAAEALIDYGSMINRSVDGLKLTIAERRAFHDGALTGLKNTGGLLGIITRLVQEGGDYSLLRLYREGDKPHLLFRLIHPGGEGVNYHDHLVRKQPDGSYRIIDTKVAVSGEFASESFRRGAAGVVAERAKAAGQPVPAEALALLDAGDDLKKAADLKREGRDKEALALLEALPSELQKSKLVLLSKIQASQKVDEVAYKKAIDDFRAAFPHDPAADFHALDSYTLGKQWDEALACLDRIDKGVGGDPYLDCTRAGLLKEKGDLAGARAAADRAVEALPDLVMPYWTRVDVALSEKDFAGTLELLKEIDGRFEVEWNDLAGTAGYEEFVKSPEYGQWKEYLKAQEAEAEAEAEAEPKPPEEPAAGT
jgi:tetratricopeptide (TPR) repeat protein